jgi:arylsulfatase A-like enzyme
VAPPDLEPYTHENWEEPMKIYAAMIEHLDRAVGEVTKVIDEMKIADHTIIIFTSDNGPRSLATPELTRVAEFFDSNGPYTGYKRDMYEGGIREPTVVRWPGQVPVNATNDMPWYFADFFPTAVDLAGAKPPAHLDGISVLPVLLGKAKDEVPRFFYWEFYERGFEQAAQWGKWKAVRHALKEPIELYDLTDDRAEKHNLANQHPDIVERFAAYLKEQHVDSPEFPVDHPMPKKSAEGG